MIMWGSLGADFGGFFPLWVRAAVSEDESDPHARLDSRRRFGCLLRSGARQVVFVRDPHRYSSHVLGTQFYRDPMVSTVDRLDLRVELVFVGG